MGGNEGVRGLDAAWTCVGWTSVRRFASGVARGRIEPESEGEMLRTNHNQTARTRTRFLALAAAVVAGLLAAPAASPAATTGKVNFERNATSSFAIPWLRDSNAEQRQWMHDNYERMRGYPPYHDQFLSWGPAADFYQDLYAIYRDVQEDQDLMQQHPAWVLKDSSGKKLFIPWACSGGTCPAYAADIGNPAFRQHWIDQASEILSRGYSGIFIDNVNMDMMVGDGQGNIVRPIDPRTGNPMTNANWRRYVAEFTEQIRAALPGATITHNAGQWWTSESDQYYQREVDAADRVEIERGFNDTGLTGGSGTFSFSNYLAHVDWLHSHGASFVAEPYNIDQSGASFELASYFLVSEGGDAIASDFHADPDNWWSGWDVDLGDAQGARHTQSGVLTRDFSKGATFVNAPGGNRQTVTLPTDGVWKNLNGNTVTQVTLDPHEGAVLTKEPVVQDPPDDPPDDPPVVDPPVVDPPPVDKLTLRPSRHRVRPGRRVKLSGDVPADSTTVDLMVRVDGDWRTAMDDTPADGGQFTGAVAARRHGRRVGRFRAVSEGLESRIVRVRIAPPRR